MPSSSNVVTTDDDIYLNDGGDFTPTGDYYPGEPEERAIEKDEKNAPVITSYPIMGAVADWFAEQVKKCDNLDNIIASEQHVDIKVQVLAMKRLKELLQEKAHEWEKFRES